MVTRIGGDSISLFGSRRELCCYSFMRVSPKRPKLCAAINPPKFLAHNNARFSNDAVYNFLQRAHPPTLSRGGIRKPGTPSHVKEILLRCDARSPFEANMLKDRTTANHFVRVRAYPLCNFMAKSFGNCRGIRLCKNIISAASIAFPSNQTPLYWGLVVRKYMGAVVGEFLVWPGIAVHERSNQMISRRENIRINERGNYNKNFNYSHSP